MNHAIYIAFFFALGACVGSFLNVVVWRLPRGESLVTPPSHCPKCNTPLKWYDNLPIVGWIKLGGRCRHCKNPISPRYPIVEAVTALLFVFFYVMFFILQIGPCAPVPVRIATSIVPPSSLFIERDWAMYLLCMAMLSALLAASLIDAELFIIPIEIPWLIAAIAVLFHAFMDQPTLPGALNLVDSVGRPTAANALAAGGGVGLAASLLLWWRGVLPTSFPQGEPMLEVDREALLKEIETAKREGRDEATLENMAVPPTYDRKQIRGEIRKEMIFLLPPMTLAVLWLTLTLTIPPIRDAWASVTRHAWATGLLGSIFGGLIGGGVVWLTRILGTLGFGRVAMGLGDVHLMLGVGAVIGAGPSTVAFFLAPFCGIAVALYLLITGHRREIPYGPYLSMGTAAVLLFYCPIEAWLAPGLAGLRDMLMGRL